MLNARLQRVAYQKPGIPENQENLYHPPYFQCPGFEGRVAWDRTNSFIQVSGKGKLALSKLLSSWFPAIGKYGIALQQILVKRNSSGRQDEVYVVMDSSGVEKYVCFDITSYSWR